MDVFLRVVNLESDLVELRDGVTTDFTRCAIVVGNALGAILDSTTNNNGTVIDLADDENWTDNTRDETLEDDSLVIVNGDVLPTGRERDGGGRRRGVVGIRRMWMDAIGGTRAFVHVNDINNEHIPATSAGDKGRSSIAMTSIKTREWRAIRTFVRGARARYTKVLC
jgi:hypothetical protein